MKALAGVLAGLLLTAAAGTNATPAQAASASSAEQLQLHNYDDQGQISLISSRSHSSSSFDTGAPGAVSAPAPQIETTSGSVKGAPSKLRSSVSAFLGIPFAKPPVGGLRWTAPQKIGRAPAPIDGTKFVSSSLR
jgi:hypothetical protein